MVLHRLRAAEENTSIHVGCGGEVWSDGTDRHCGACDKNVPASAVIFPQDIDRDVYVQDVRYLLALLEGK